MESQRNDGRFIYKTYPDMELAFYLEQPRNRIFEYAPVIMHNIGGGWSHFEIPDKALYTFPEQEKLLDEGYAILAVGYRGGDNGEQMVDIMADLIDALAYIHARNDIFKLDLMRLVPIGGSAGGHVSLMVTMAPHELMTKTCVNITEGFAYGCMGCVGIVPPTILYPDPESGKMLFPIAYTSDASIKHLFSGEEYDAPCYKTYSPLTYARPDLPPILLLAGEKDDVVSPRQSELLHEALTAAGVNSELIIVKNGDHGLNSPDGETQPPREETDHRMYTFISDLLK